MTLNSLARALKRAREGVSRTSSAWLRLLSSSEVGSLWCWKAGRVSFLGLVLDALNLLLECHGSFRAMRILK